MLTRATFQWWLLLFVFLLSRPIVLSALNTLYQRHLTSQGVCASHDPIRGELVFKFTMLDIINPKFKSVDPDVVPALSINCVV